MSLGNTISILAAATVVAFLLFFIARKSTKEPARVLESDWLQGLKQGTSLIIKGRHFLIQETLFLGDAVLHRLQATDSTVYWLHVDHESRVELWRTAAYEGALPSLTMSPLELAYTDAQGKKKIFVHAYNKSRPYTWASTQHGGSFEQIEYTERHNPEDLLIFMRLNNQPFTAYHGISIPLQDLSV